MIFENPNYDLMSKKKYIPKKRHNPEHQALLIDNLEEKIEQHRRELEIVTASYDKHMEYLANFARHDMGNAIQTMDATVTLAESNFQPEHLKSLRSCVDNLNAILDNFEKLVPYSKTGDFELSRLLIALETMNRSAFSLEHIKSSFIYDKSKVITLSQPYQALLQILHNLVINAIKALKEVSAEKIIEISADADDKSCWISVKDTGCGILDENVSKIFDYKYTTTNGTGIGLYHAKYVCKNIDGSIDFQRNVDGFSTIFTIKFPLNGNKGDSDN